MSSCQSETLRICYIFTWHDCTSKRLVRGTMLYVCIVAQRWCFMYLFLSLSIYLSIYPLTHFYHVFQTHTHTPVSCNLIILICNFNIYILFQVFEESGVHYYEDGHFWMEVPGLPESESDDDSNIPVKPNTKVTFSSGPIKVIDC